MKRLMLLALVASFTLVATLTALAEAVETIRCNKDRVCIGTNNAEIIFGNTEKAYQNIKARAGDDRVYAQTNANTFVKGGDGGDQIFGKDGYLKTHGNLGNDTIYGTRRGDAINPGPGQDTVYAGGGNDNADLRDGERDRIECAGGSWDTVRADAEDAAVGCTRVYVEK